ncbi:MAG: LEPR-XLL domain-containing protein [Phycisphaeraceae bacterium]|nr:MAG: LEPR-XLL domain-containing protein [Phycisphaeraceae bacterium]
MRRGASILHKDGRGPVPRFEQLEPRLLLSADLLPVAADSPAEYGAFLFERSLVAESLAFDHTNGRDGDQQRPQSVFAAVSLMGSTAVGAADQARAADFELERPADRTEQTDRRLQRPSDRGAGGTDSITSMNHTLARTGAHGLEPTADEPVGPLPDLVVVDAHAPATAGPGETVRVSWTVENRGAESASTHGWHDAVYFSYDGEWDRFDRQLATIWTGADAKIEPGQTYTRSADVTLPDNLVRDGNLLVYTNRWSHLPEANSSNNTLALPVTVDLDRAVANADGDAATQRVIGPDDAISVEQARAFVSGFREIADWARDLSVFENFTDELPLVGDIVGPDAVPLDLGSLFESIDLPVGVAEGFVDLGDLLRRQLFDPLEGLLQPFIDDPLGVAAPSIKEVLQILQDVETDGFNNSISFGDVLQSPGEIGFSLQYNIEETIGSLALNLGQQAEDLNIDLDGELTADLALTASLALDLGFGINLSSGLAPTEAFFITDDSSLTVGAAISTSSLNVEGRVGFATVSIMDGSLDLNVEAEVTFNDPSPTTPGRMTINDFRGASLSSLLKLDISGAYAADLTLSGAITGPTVGGSPIDIAGNASVIVSNSEAGDPYSAPTINLSDFSLLDSFRNISANDVLGLLNELAGWLEALNNSGILSQVIPFTRGQGDLVVSEDAGGEVDQSANLAVARLGDILGIGEAFQDQLLGILTIGEQFNEGAPVFESVQDLVALLNAIAMDSGVPVLSMIEVGFDTGLRELTFRLDPELDFEEVYPFHFGLDADPLGGVNLSGDVTIAGSVGLDLLFGIELTPVGDGLTFDTGSLLSEINGGSTPDFPAFRPIDGVDFTIHPRDGVSFDVDLDASTITFGDLFDRINNAPGNNGRVIAEFNSEFNAIVLRETEEVEVPEVGPNEDEPRLFVEAAEVEPDDEFLEGAGILVKAPAALQLGLLSAAVTDEAIHRLIGNPLHGQSLADKFFIRDSSTFAADLSIDIELDEGDITLGILGLSLAGSSGQGNVGFEFGLQALEDAEGKLSLRDLYNRVGDPLGLDIIFDDDTGEKEFVPTPLLRVGEASMRDGEPQFEGFFDFLDQTISGDVSITFVVSDTQPIDVLSIFGQDQIELTLSIADLRNIEDFTLDAGDLEDFLRDFTSLTPGQIIDALLGFLDYIDDLASSGGVPFLNQPLPVIDISIGDAVGFVNGLRGRLETLRDDAETELESLRQQIEDEIAALPFVVQSDDTGSIISLARGDGDDPEPRPTPEVRFDYQEGIFTIGLDILVEFANETFSLDFDLESLIGAFGVDADLGFLTDLIDVQGSSELSVSAGVVISVNIGLDLTQATPELFFWAQEDAEEGDPPALQSRIEFFALIEGDDVEFSAQLGPASATIEGGLVSLGDRASVGAIHEAIKNDESPDDLDPATVLIGFDPAGAVNGRYSFTEAINNIQFEVDAAVQIDLPISVELFGLAPEVTNLQLYISDLVDFTGEDVVKLVLPDIDLDNISLLDQIILVVDGFDFVLGGVQQFFEGSVAGVTVPFIGDQLEPVATFIEDDIRAGVVAPFRSFLTTAEDELTDGVISGLTTFRNIVFDVFNDIGLLLPLDGAANPEDFFFQDRVAALRGAVSQDDVDLSFEMADGSVLKLSQLIADGVSDDFDILEVREILVDLRIGKLVSLADVDFGFDIGIPGFALDFDTDVSVEFGFVWAISFGFNFTEGFFLDVTEDPDFRVFLELTLDDIEAGITLGILRADIRGDATASAFASASLEVNLKNPDAEPGERQRLSFLNIAGAGAGAGGAGRALYSSADRGSGFIDVSVGFDAGAFLPVQAGINLPGIKPGSGNFPSVSTDVAIDWSLSLGATNRVATPGDLSIDFSNVQLFIGEFFAEFLQPIVIEINQAMEPIRPIVDILTARLPVISDLRGSDVSLVDLANLFSTLSPKLSSLKFIGAAVEIIELVDSVVMLATQIDDDGRVPLGDFQMLVLPDGSVRRPLSDDAGFFNAMSEEDIFDSLVQNAGDGMVQQATESVVGSTRSAKLNFDMPLLSDPFAAFGLLAGDSDVDLFRFNAELRFGFFFSSFFSIVGPLGARFSGSINAEINFGIGFDAAGLPRAIETIQSTDNPATIAGAVGLAVLDGLFIDDHVTFGPNGQVIEDKPEVRVYGSISAALAVSVGIAEGGVRGGVFASIEVDLMDINSDGDLVRTDDGKLRINEIIRIVQGTGNPFCIFNLSGTVEVFLDAYIAVGPCPFCKEWSFEFARLRLISFSIACEFPEIEIAQQGGPGQSVLFLNIGDRANQRGGYENVQDEEIVISQTGEGADMVIAVSGFGEDQYFGPGVDPDDDSPGMFFNPNPITRIVAPLAGGNDIITLDPSVNVEFVAYFPSAQIGVAAGDKIIVGGSGRNIIFGGRGNSVLVGGPEDDILVGGYGFNINPSDANLFEKFDVLYDELRAEAGIVESRSRTYRGAGFSLSQLIATPGDGNNKIFGNAGADLIFGQGGTGANQGAEIYAGPGDDVVFGGPGNDRIFGVRGLNLLVGNGGSDYIDGGENIDIIYGDFHPLQTPPPGYIPGTNTIHGNAGNDRIHAGHGGDVIFGGAGDDTIFGGDGDDYIEGGAGNNWIHGGAGDDTIYGHDAPETRSTGPAGNNIIIGGLGDDRIFGGPKSDVIYGDETDPSNPDGGNDIIRVGGGNNLVFGGPGNDTIFGGPGNDTIYADSEFDNPQHGFGPGPGNTIFTGDGENIVFGSPRDDFIQGGAGDDLIYANAGNNQIYGGAGDDRIFGGPGNDIIFGQEGDDVIYGVGGRNQIFGNDGDDLLFGGDGDDLILGGPGNDIIRAGRGDDEIYGGPGRNIIYGDSGANLIFAGPLGDIIYGGDGDDFIQGGAGDDVIYAGLGDNTILAGDGDDRVFGGPGRDTIFGQSGQNLLVAGAGVGNRIYAGTGDDIIYGSDEAIFNSDFNPFILLRGDDNPYGDFIDLTAGGRNIVFGLGGHNFILGGDDGDWIYAGERFGSVVLAGAGDDVIYGSFFGDDYIDGGPGNDTIFGNGGRNVLHGGDGADVIYGGFGDDEIFGGPGDDLLIGVGGNNRIFGGPGDDVIYGAAGGDDELYGGDGNDRIFGVSGNNFIDGGPGDDALFGGSGDDLIFGDHGNDLIVGGFGNNILFGFRAYVPDTDGGNDVIYGDAGLGLPHPLDGNDLIFGGAGSDQLFGEGGDDFIDPGPGRYDIIDFGPDEGDIPEDWIPPDATIPAPPLPPLRITFSSPDLPIGPDLDGRRWAEYARSANGAGLSGAPQIPGAASTAGLSFEQDIAAAPNAGQHVVWVDSRDNVHQIYHLHRTPEGAWVQFGDAAQGGGLSQSNTSSRRPTVALDDSGAPIVAWTEFHDGGADIRVARWSESAGAWIGLGDSFELHGISATGAADHAQIINTASGPVVAWIDSSQGAANVYAKRFDGAAWVELGAGSASGEGISGSASDVEDLAIATDGAKIAFGWTQQVGDAAQIYLREFTGAAFTALGGSANLGGVSDTPGPSATPSLAYHNGELFVAWQDRTTPFVTPPVIDPHDPIPAPDRSVAFGSAEVVVRRFDGANWIGVANDIPDSLDGQVSRSDELRFGQASRPQLASDGDSLHLAWLDDTPALREIGTTSIFSTKWDGAGFAEVLPGDASDLGVSPSGGVIDGLALAVAGGSPYVAWTDAADGAQNVYFRGDEFQIGDIHSLEAGDSLADLLAGAALQPGDVVLLGPGVFTGGATIGAAASGVLFIGAPDGSTVIDGPVTLNGAADVSFQRLQISGGLTATNTTGLLISDVTFTGQGLTLNASEGATVSNSRFLGAGVVVDGATQDLSLLDSAFTGAALGIDVQGETDNLLIRGVTMQNVVDGLRLGAESSGLVLDNGFAGTGVGVGIGVAAGFTGSIARNDVSGFATGVHHTAPAPLSANMVHGNIVGVESHSANIESGLGFYGDDLSPNEIVNNQTGVILHGWMQNQIIRDSQLGVTGAGVLGGLDLDLANLIEANELGVDFDGVIRFNRIASNVVGVLANDGQLLHNNMLFRNAGADLRIDGAERIVASHNTFFAPTGGGVEAMNGASEVELRGNIFWSEAAPALTIAEDSQSGFFSDFNTFHAPLGAVLVRFAGVDFADFVDWFDLGVFDQSSIGQSAAAPDFAMPRFLHADRDDFRIFDPGAGRRFDSPTVDSSDPLTDLGVAFRNNLLANANFGAGLSGWSASGGQLAPAANALTGGAIFSAAPGDFIETAVHLVDDAGFDAADLDTGFLRAVFGGRFRADDIGAAQGRLTLSFFADPEEKGEPPVFLESFIVDPGAGFDRWALDGDRVGIPEGARLVELRFEALPGAGSPVLFDSAFLFIEAEAWAPDMGAQGFSSEDNENIGARLLLRSPDFDTAWGFDEVREIRWDSYNNIEGRDIRIDLLIDGVEGPEFLTNIFQGAADVGSLLWAPAKSDIPIGVEGLRIQISFEGNHGVMDRSAAAFGVVDPATEGVEIAEVIIAGGQQQRSNVDKIQVRFAGETNIAERIADGSIADFIKLYRSDDLDNSMAWLTADRFAWNETLNLLTIDLTVDGDGGQTILDNGLYTLKVLLPGLEPGASGGARADGDWSAIDRSDASPVADFFRLYGDLTGSGVVNAQDLAQLLSVWGTSDPVADLTGSGVVNAQDLAELLSVWGTTVWTDSPAPLAGDGSDVGGAGLVDSSVTVSAPLVTSAAAGAGLLRHAAPGETLAAPALSMPAAPASVNLQRVGAGFFVWRDGLHDDDRVGLREPRVRLDSTLF